VSPSVNGNLSDMALFEVPETKLNRKQKEQNQTIELFISKSTTYKMPTKLN